MEMILTKQPKFLLKRHHLPLLRHFCTEHNSPLPQVSESSIIITQALDVLLQTPDNEWTSSPQIKNLLFSSTSLSPQLFFQITRRFPSSSRALSFFNFLQSNLPTEANTSSLSYAYQAVFELAIRERMSPESLFDLYKACKDQNIPLSINSATLLIRFFGKVSMYDYSLLVYNELDNNLRNTHVRNVLIDVLLRCDHDRDAFNVLDEMLDRESQFPVNELTGDIVFYALMRREHVKNSVTDEELVGLVCKFAEHGVFPNAVWLTQLITRFCRKGKTDEAWDVLHVLMKFDAPLEAASCNALLNALGREGDFKRMNQLFTEMKENDIEPSVVTFGTIINRLCKLYRADEALEVFEKMIAGKETAEISVEPDVIIFNTLIDGLCKVGKQEEALGLIEQMRLRLQKGCMPNAVTYNCLINGFCKSGNIEKGLELFHLMKQEGVTANVVTLNTLVDGMCRHGRINSAVEFFQEVTRKGLCANAVTYTILITAFCNVNNFQGAIKWFDDMSRAGCSADSVVYFTLISSLCQAGRMNDASLVVSKLKEAGFRPDIVCYNHLISGFCKKKMLDKAYEVLQEMEDIGMTPNSVTYNTLISFLSKSGNFSAARRVLKKMVKEGLEPTVVTYGALIHAFCVNGHVDEAMKIFKELSSSSNVSPNTVIYNILIDSLCKNNQVELALSLMEEMKVKEVRPNTNTYNAMFKGLRQKNMLDKAFKLMDRMIEHACHPDYISMEILTEWLSEAGQTEKLKKFVQGYAVSAAPA
ncbi:hypothetical protein AB3S75_021442 [Citrus x aurantiifolia]